MNLTDYILEAADVTDVDMFDIEIEQTLAEIAVAEAMLDCIEKQDVLLEYNEDSAEEIITESSMLWVLEAANKYDSEIKSIQQLIDLGNQEIKYVNDILNNSEKLKQMTKEQKADILKLRDQLRTQVDDMVKIRENLTALGKPGVEKSMKNAEKRSEKIKQAKTKSSEIKNVSDALAKLGVFPTGKTAAKVTALDNKIANLKDVADEIGNEGKAFNYTTKGAAEEYKNKMKESASGFKSSAKGAANATGAFLTKVALGLRTLIANVLSLIFATKFDKLADKLEQMDSVVVEMNYTESTYLLRIGVVLKQLIPEFDNTVVKPLSSFSKPGSGTIENVDKACDTINKKIQTVVSGVKEVKKDKDSKSTVGAVDKDIIIDICRTLGNGEMKRTMNNIRFMIGKWNLEFEGVPKKTAQHVRKTFNKLNNFFGTAARAMSKIYKIAKKNDSVNKDIDLSKLDEGDMMYKSDFDAMVNEPINTDNDTKNESFSMKLSDEDFF